MEEAQGLRDIVLEDSVCNHWILASSAKHLVIRYSVVHGVIEANTDSLLCITNNTVHPQEGCSGSIVHDADALAATRGDLRRHAALDLTGIYM